MSVGIVLVDHGSRRKESNQSLERMAKALERAGPYGIVEPAHMELAEPTIEQAFGACVHRGATEVMVSPFFFFSGRHITEDIPAVVEQAAQGYPLVRYRIAKPLGEHPLMLEVVRARISESLAAETPGD